MMFLFANWSSAEHENYVGRQFNANCDRERYHLEGMVSEFTWKAKDQRISVYFIGKMF